MNIEPEDYEFLIGLFIVSVIISIMLYRANDDIPKLNNGTRLYEVIDY